MQLVAIIYSYIVLLPYIHVATVTLHMHTLIVLISIGLLEMDYESRDHAGWKYSRNTYNYIMFSYIIGVFD